MADIVGPLRLRVQVIEACGVHGGKALALCTEQGDVVGQQVATSVSSEAGEMGTITVTFQIDGETISFEETPGGMSKV
jgi:hypothetical protein